MVQDSGFQPRGQRYGKDTCSPPFVDSAFSLMAHEFLGCRLSQPNDLDMQFIGLTV